MGFALALSLVLTHITSCSDDDDGEDGAAGTGGIGAEAGAGGLGQEGGAGAGATPSPGEGGAGASAGAGGADGGATSEGGAGAGGAPFGGGPTEGGSSGFGGAAGFGGVAGFAGSEVGGESGAGGSDGAFTASRIVGEPVVIELDPSGNGEPSSLFWSQAGDYLLIADNRGNRIWKWTSGAGVSLYATTTGLPADPSPPTTGSRDDVGQLVELADGTVVVTRFGFQTHANVLWVKPGTDDKGQLLGIDPTRRRVSLLVTSDQQLYSGYFSGPANARVAAVTKLAWVTSGDSGSAESDYAPGFKKPVGLLEYGSSILAVDQESNVIYKLPKSASALTPPYEVFAEIEAPDQLAAGPDGSVFTGQFRAESGPLSIRQISPEGEVVVFDSELTRPSGVAYDPDGKRLFAADNNGTNIRQIRVYQLE